MREGDRKRMEHEDIPKYVSCDDDERKKERKEGKKEGRKERRKEGRKKERKKERKQERKNITLLQRNQ
jgi:hypothetical protein